jgi:hypothetical protein
MSIYKESLFYGKWLNINEYIAYRKIICCRNVIKIKSIRKYLFKTKCKWENKGRGDTTPPPPRLAGSQNIK